MQRGQRARRGPQQGLHPPEGRRRRAWRLIWRFCRGCASMGPSMWCTTGAQQNSRRTDGSWPSSALQARERGQRRRAQRCGKPRS